MDNCIFCKIINQEIPSVKVYEDDQVYAFLDISQTTKGHTLIVPKKHIENIFESDDAIVGTVHQKAAKLAKALKEAFQAKGINIINNNGEQAGQTVFHYHVHIIPRYNEDDGYRAIYTNHMDKYSKEDLTVLAEKIKKNL